MGDLRAVEKNDEDAPLFFDQAMVMGKNAPEGVKETDRRNGTSSPADKPDFSERLQSRDSCQKLPPCFLELASSCIWRRKEDAAYAS